MVSDSTVVLCRGHNRFPRPAAAPVCQSADRHLPRLLLDADRATRGSRTDRQQRRTGTGAVGFNSTRELLQHFAAHGHGGGDRAGQLVCAASLDDQRHARAQASRYVSFFLSPLLRSINILLHYHRVRCVQDKCPSLTATETRDGKKSYDAGPHSKEMLALNKKFGRVHGISSLVNMISLIATVYYGAVLSKRLQ